MTPADRLRAIVENYVGAARDNVHRAEVEFRDRAAAEMQQEYGNSGMTRLEVLDDYRFHLRCAIEARDLLHRLLGPDRTYPTTPPTGEGRVTEERR